MPVARAQPHSEQPAKPTAADEAAIAAAIAQIQARIAQLTAEEQRQEQQTSPTVSIVEQPSGASSAIDWARRLF